MWRFNITPIQMQSWEIPLPNCERFTIALMPWNPSTNWPYWKIENIIENIDILRQFCPYAICIYGIWSNSPKIHFNIHLLKKVVKISTDGQIETSLWYSAPAWLIYYCNSNEHYLRGWMHAVNGGSVPSWGAILHQRNNGLERPNVQE